MIKTNAFGFTIVETMMFLAVSGVLFFSVAMLISGELDNVQSKDAMNQMESLVGTTLNDVSNGYYPLNNIDITCNNNTLVRGTTNNTSCLLAGKSITFYKSYMAVDSLVTSGQTMNLPTTFTSSSSDTINVALGVITNVPPLRQVFNYPWGITTTSLQTYYILNNVYSTAYNTNFISGSQTVSLYYINNHNVLSLAAQPQICFKNGNHNSSLTLNNLTVTIKYVDNQCQ